MTLPEKESRKISNNRYFQLLKYEKAMADIYYHVDFIHRRTRQFWRGLIKSGTLQKVIDYKRRIDNNKK